MTSKEPFKIHFVRGGGGRQKINHTFVTAAAVAVAATAAAVSHDMGFYVVPCQPSLRTQATAVTNLHGTDKINYQTGRTPFKPLLVFNLKKTL